MSSLGERVKSTRKAKGLSQAQLAKIAKVSQPVISDYENNIVTEHRVHILMSIQANGLWLIGKVY
jgi:transcriptional regulator with XRE-family HTH domain